MPIYEYHCRDCGAKFEQRRTFSQADDPLNCPQCESMQVERLMSSFMLSFSRWDGLASTGPTRGCAACSAGSCATCR